MAHIRKIKVKGIQYDAVYQGNKFKMYIGRSDKVTGEEQNYAIRKCEGKI